MGSSFEAEDTMSAARAFNIKLNDPVWVWDASWLPAIVTDVVSEPDRNFVIVHFENGCSAPASWTNVAPRDSSAHGRDRPLHHGV